MAQGLISEKFLASQVEEEPQPEPTTAVEPPKRRKPKLAWPKGLTVICILFALISVLGITSAVSTTTTMLTTKQEESDLSHMGNDFRARKMKKKIREMEAQAMATRNKYMPCYIYLEATKFGVSIAFALGVAMLIVRHPKARRFALITCGVALFYHVSAIGIACISSVEVLGPISSFFQASAADPNLAPDLTAAEREELATSMTRTLGGFFMVVIALYLLTKFVFYGVIMAYFCQTEIKEMFDGQLEGETPDEASLEAAPA